jgi:signal transduction histidine kinase
MSLVGQQPRFASLVAAEDTDLLCIDADDFPRLMDEHPNVSWAILNVLNDRLYAADLARTTIIQEEQVLSDRVERLAGEAERQAKLAGLRQETLALIAHDMRSPLAVIDGCLGMLESSLPADALAASGEILGLALRSSERLSGLVSSLLDAARQESPNLALIRRPVNLADLLANTVWAAEATAKESQLTLTVDIAPDLPRLLGDVDKLERVIINLLENAMAYTPDEGQVWVAARRQGDDVEVSVTDTGPGVPIEYRESIFERFVRVPGLQGRRRGFGLGLYFCRQVVEAHGGNIWVEKGPGGKGSRFVFALPLER